MLASLTGGFAQDYGLTNDSLYLGFYRDSIAQLDRPTLIIVPFHPDKYMSEVDHDIAKGTSYTYQHTRGFFRKGLDNALLIASKEWNEYVSMHADDADVNHDLDFIYKTVAPSVQPYVAPVINEDHSFKTRLANKWMEFQGMVETGPEPGTRIEQGQIISVPQNQEYITKAKIYNEIIFDSINKKYGGDYYVFINELDILNGATDQRQLESDQYQRIIKVHYSVYDSTGTEMFSLIKKRGFSSRENDLRTIITEHFLPMGHEVIYSIDSYRFLQAGLVPVPLEEDEKGLQNIWPLSKKD